MSKIIKKFSKSKALAKSKKTAKAAQTAQAAFAVYSREKLEKSLHIDARALGILPGAADAFIEGTLDAVEKNLGSKENISDHELTSAIAKELKKYHADFAYIYQNRGKII